jgi:hypothetical protein
MLGITGTVAGWMPVTTHALTDPRRVRPIAVAIFPCAGENQGCAILVALALVAGHRRALLECRRLIPAVEAPTP